MSDTDARLQAYADEQQLTLEEARARLITIALDHLDARRRGGERRRKGMSKTERSDAARKAVQARWRKPSDVR